MPDEIMFFELADFFKVLGDTTRVKILFELSKESLWVSELAKRVNMNQSAVSHQLRILKQARLVRARRRGREIYYSLDDEHVEELFKKAMEHLEEKMFKKPL